LKRLLTILLLAVFVNSFLFAQLGINRGTALKNIKNILLNSKQEKNVPPVSDINPGNLEKPNATYTSLYVSRYFTGGPHSYELDYMSHKLKDPIDYNIIKSGVPPLNLFTEGTMDDEGYWYGLFFFPFDFDGAAGLNKANGDVPPKTIKKIDKSTGEIVREYPIDPDCYYLGLAFNPVDKLIYFLQSPLPDGAVNGGSSLSKPNIFDGTILYSLNPKTGEIIKVNEFDELLFGLACSNSGVFYTVTDSHDELRMAKFTLGSFCLEVFGVDLVMDEHLYPDYIDLEIDPTTGKCYMVVLNYYDPLTSTEKTDADDYGSEFREISLLDGRTALLYTWGKYIVGGLAFDRTIDVLPTGNGKFAITSPNGGEKLRGGKYQYITWIKTGGIVPGSIQLEYSTDGGSTWKKINTAPIAGVMRYSWLVPANINSNRCLVRIVNYISRKEIDRSDDEFAINTATAVMASNFPNPFNPITKIVFTIAKSAQTSLRVYNALGQQVAELVNKQLESGVHEYEFNAANLPSGVYIYKLESDGVSEMHKMILMK